MRKLIPLLVLLVVTPSLAQGIYKWVDDQGQVHYTDTPQENSGAEEVKLQPLPTYSSPSADTDTVDTQSEDSGDSNAANDMAAYRLLEITSPSMEETIWNTGGIVTAALRLQPALQMGHTIQVSMDGNPVDTVVTQTSTYQLTDVVRGEHQLQIAVLDENGAMVIQSEPVTFFYQQTSVNRRPGNR